MRPRYETLDALRGIAAIGVMICHYFMLTQRAYVPLHFYLAVDFAFCLSGFMVAHAYEHRLSRWTWVHFMRIRMVRLWPMLALTMVLAAARFLFAGHSLAEVLTLVILGLLVLPTLTRPEGYFTTSPFPLNPPLWSTFFEIAANAVWALVAPKLTIRVLVVVIGVSAALLGYLEHLTPDYKTFGVEEFWAGIPRVIVSYASGVLAYRLHESGRNPFKASLWVVGAALTAILAAPIYNNVAFDLVCLALLPVIVLAGIGGRQPEGLVARASLWLGDLSYPLYAMHWPMFLIMMDVLMLAGVEYAYWPYLLGMMGVVVLASWAAMRFFDDPVRALLSSSGKARAEAARAPVP